MNSLTRVLVHGTSILRSGDRSAAVDYVIDAVQDMISTNIKALDKHIESADLYGTDPGLVVVAITTMWYRKEDLANLADYYEKVSKTLLVYGYHEHLDALAAFRELLIPSTN
jgi:hypothetical protein